MIIKIASMKEKKSNSSETKRNNLSELIWDHVYLFIYLFIYLLLLLLLLLFAPLKLVCCYLRKQISFKGLYLFIL